MTINQQILDEVEHAHVLVHLLLSAVGFTPQETAMLIADGINGPSWNKCIAMIRDRTADHSSLAKRLDAIEATLKQLGGVSPQDQQLLDGLLARSATIVNKLDALDAQTVH